MEQNSVEIDLNKLSDTRIKNLSLTMFSQAKGASSTFTNDSIDLTDEMTVGPASRASIRNSDRLKLFQNGLVFGYLSEAAYK